MNFVDGGEESEGLIFTGSEGTMEIGGECGEREPRAAREGAGLHDRTRFTEAMQKEIHAEYDEEVSAHASRGRAAGGLREVRGAGAATATATTTSRTSLPRCARASRWWKMRSSASARPARRC